MTIVSGAYGSVKSGVQEGDDDTPATPTRLVDQHHNAIAYLPSSGLLPDSIFYKKRARACCAN